MYNLCNLCVCVYVCMCTCVYVCMCVCVSMMYNLIHNAGSCAMSVLIMDDTWPTLFYDYRNCDNNENNRRFEIWKWYL